MSLLSEIKAIIAAAGTVTMGSMPDTPDNVLTVYHYGSADRDAAGEQWEHPLIQVAIRNSSYAAGEAVLHQVSDLLHGYVGGKFRVILQRNSGCLGQDDKQRYKWTANFAAMYKR